MASREQLSEDLLEARAELEEMRTQMDQLQEDNAQEMEELEEQLKAQYAEEIGSLNEQVGALTAQAEEANASWEASYNELQEAKTAMETDYESKLATWTKSREQGREVWTNPVTGETASHDATWKNDRERKLEADMKKMKEKLDRNNAETRKGSSRVQEVQSKVNEMRAQIKMEGNAHNAARRRHHEDLQASWDEIGKLEAIVMDMSEELERNKMALNEQITWQSAIEQSAAAQVLRARLEQEDARRTNASAMKAARLVQLALERELRRRIRTGEQLGLQLAEGNTRAANAEAIKQREFDVLRVKLSKAREVHQDDLESLARLWPDEKGYVLPTMLQPYADVLRIERERREHLATLGPTERGPDDIDTDSDDEGAQKHREDLERELAALREEILFPSLRQIKNEELAAGPRFKVVSTTPRRRRFALFDTPRAFIDKLPVGEVLDGEDGGVDIPQFGPDGEPLDNSAAAANEFAVIGASGAVVNPPGSIVENLDADADATAITATEGGKNLKIELPRHILLQARERGPGGQAKKGTGGGFVPSTAVGSVAKFVRRGGGQAFEGEPWDSDDSSYVPSDSETPRGGHDMLLKDHGDGQEQGKKEEEQHHHQQQMEGQPRPPQVSTLALPAANASDAAAANPDANNTDSKSGDLVGPINPITGQPLKLHSVGPALGAVAVTTPLLQSFGSKVAVPAPGAPGLGDRLLLPRLTARGMSSGMPSVPGAPAPATTTTFLSQAGIDPNQIVTPRTMTRLYAKAGITQIKRLLRAGLHPLGDLTRPKAKEDDEEGDADDEGGGEEGDEGEAGVEGAEGSGKEKGSDDESGSGSDSDGSNDSDASGAISSGESDSDESDVSSVDIDAELGIASDGVAAQLAKEAAAKKKLKETWTDEERAIFEHALEDIAEYDPDRRWIKIQKRVKTRSLKECKKFMKVLDKERKARNREIKQYFHKELVDRVIAMQTPADQVFDALLWTVLGVERNDYCRNILTECADNAVMTAPSTIRIELERHRLRDEEEKLRKQPWLSLKTKSKLQLPRVLARAIRSMLRNGTLTKPRAHKLVELYRRAPTLEEEDEAAAEEESIVAASSAHKDVGGHSHGGISERSISSMVGEAITLAEADEPFADLELEETAAGKKDTEGRLASRLAFRRHESMLQRETMVREREYTFVWQRSRYLKMRVAAEREREGMALVHVESMQFDRDCRQKVRDDWERVVVAEDDRIAATARVHRTLVIPKEMDWTPPTTEEITKERVRKDPTTGQPLVDPKTGEPTGEMETYTEIVNISEKRSLEIQADVVKGTIAKVTRTVPIEGLAGTDREGETKEERVHPDPIAVHVEKWGKKDEYDPSGAVPIWVCRVEMPDEAAMGNIRRLFPKNVAATSAAEEKDQDKDAVANEPAPESGGSSGSPHLCTRSIVERLNAQQALRREKLERLETIVRKFNAKACVCEETARQAAAVCGLRTEQVKDAQQEMVMFHRRSASVNRMQSVHAKLMGWIAHRAERSKQTKDELMLLAKNAKHKVRRAKEAFDAARNPLTRAFCEQRLNEKLREADKVLRYVRKRFHAELDVRRRLAQERRDGLLQQCARIDLVTTLSMERVAMWRGVRRAQEAAVISQHSIAQDCVRRAEYYEMNGDLDAAVQACVADLLSNVIERCRIKGDGHSVKTTREEAQAETRGTNPMLGQMRLWDDKIQRGSREVLAHGAKVVERQLARAREHAIVLDEIEKLEGLAGEWLADNQVQQAEDQLAVARSALDDTKHMMEAARAEARLEIEDLKETVEINELQSRASTKMFKNEIVSRRRAAGLAIAHMQKTVADTRDALETLRTEKDGEIMRMAEAHAQIMAELNARLDELELLAERRGKWVETLQVQIKLMRKKSQEFEAMHKEATEDWERQRDGLMKQLRFQQSQSERRMQWIESLKGEVARQEGEKKALREDMDRARLTHDAREKELRWNVWQRDETARRIRMDVDSIFKWFLESVANLAGASKRHNDRLFQNGCVGVLNAIIHKDNCYVHDLKPLAARALGALAWNGYVDHRVISRRSRDAWSAWIGVVAAEEKWRFDLGEDELRATIAAEAEALRAAQVELSRTAALANRTVRLLKESYAATGNARSKSEREALVKIGVLGPEYQSVSGGPLTDYRAGGDPANKVKVLTQAEVMASVGPNDRNQEAIGASYGSLNSLVALCRSDTGDVPLVLMDEGGRQGDGAGGAGALSPTATSSASNDMQRYASDALAVLSLSSENRNRMEQVQDMVPTLIELCGLDREPEVQRNAAAALGNMAFGHIGNQTSIGDSGGIEALCTLCGLSVDVDVLENATSALVNLSRNHEQNALRVGTAYGIEALVRLTNSTATADLSSLDGERVQGNAAEALVNATRNDSHENAERIRSCGVRPIVLMCTSDNLIVQRAAPLVLGNIAQNDAIRAEVGSAGGIDALFLLASSDDEIVQSNAAYAMGNLAWTASNQERIGFFMPQLLQLLHSAFAPVRENAMIALANAIHFHESNRRRLMFEAPGSLELLVRMIDDNSPLVRAHTARCLGAACHNDTVAKTAGEYTGCISGLVRLLRDRDGQCQRYAAFALKNLALYDPNKRVILENNGVEGLTHVAGSHSHEAREMASAVMDVLADLAGEDEMEAMKDKFGVGGMVDLLRTNAHNPLVAGLAADSLAEKVYGGKPSDHDAVVSAGGIEALLDLLAKGQEKGSDDPTSATMGPYTLKTLWSLRTMLRRHVEAQTRAGVANGIRIMINYIDMEKSGGGGGGEREHLHEIQSTALSILTMIVQDHEVNSRKLLRGGLDSIISLAEKILPEPQRKSRKPTPKDPSMSPGGGMHPHNNNQHGDVRPESESPPGSGTSSKRRGPVTPMDQKKPWQTIRGDEKNASAMALDILQYIGPHNWILVSSPASRSLFLLLLLLPMRLFLLVVVSLLRVLGHFKVVHCSLLQTFPNTRTHTHTHTRKHTPPSFFPHQCTNCGTRNSGGEYCVQCSYAISFKA